MQQIIIFILLVTSKSIWAGESLIFKEKLVTTIHWFPYALVLLVLLIVIGILAKKTNKGIRTHSQCKVLEKFHLHHKTKVYVFDYQGQHFLIADNQNSVAIHALKEGSNAIAGCAGM